MRFVQNFQRFHTKFATARRSFTNRNLLALKERGMYQDLFPEHSAKEITDLLNASPQCVYAGFDPTADSLHVGNLLVLINLLHWQRAGHHVIALVGGATARIGDPSGRNTERDPMAWSHISDNTVGVMNNIRTICKNHAELIWPQNSTALRPIRVLNNEQWYGSLSAVELIAKVGRHLRMGTLLSRTSVQSRLSSAAGMSFAEFSYQLFQAYDWLYLLQTHKCNFQIGGNDQMGNIMSGHDLVSKVAEKQVYGLTVPLITNELGDKFGKSAGNAVWLSDEKTSPFSFYQFWIRTPDSEVERLLKLFTFDSVGTVSDLMSRHVKSPENRLAQKTLAEQATLLVHGKEGLLKAQDATKVLYEGSVGGLSKLRAEDIADIFHGACVVEMLPQPGLSVLDLALKAGCFTTNNDALRIISAGGFYINQQRVSNPAEVLSQNAHMLANNVSLLRVGKKNYYVVKWLS